MNFYDITARREIGNGAPGNAATYGYANAGPYKYLHPIFGQVQANNAGILLANQNALDDQSRQYLLRETGILEKINHNNRILDGITRPADYLFEMNQDIERIAGEVTREFNNELQKQYNLGKPIEQCREIAMNYCKKIKEEKMKFHDAMFPTSLTKEVMGRLDRQNEVGRLR